MRRFLAPLILSAAPAFAEDTTSSALIAEHGLTGAAEQLAASPASPDRDMAIAAMRFLAGIEAAYQARWKIGATGSILPIPILGTEIYDNPDPQPLTPDYLSTLAQELSTAMQATREVLPADDAAFVLQLADVWMDLNADNQRDPGETLTEMEGIPWPESSRGEIRFDSADVAWLRAYTHLIDAVMELVLAFDPEPALEKRIALMEALKAQHEQPPGELNRTPMAKLYADNFGTIADNIAALIQTLRNQPDKDRIGKAAEHIRAMIAANRGFWTAVAAETDNDREWIPNDKQQAAMGFDIPQGAGEAWLNVLKDAEDVLNGSALIPFWRFAPGHGIDLKAWLDDPQPVDLIDWVQGSAALPYARQGLTVSESSWSRFSGMFQGRAGLYMVLFN